MERFLNTHFTIFLHLITIAIVIAVAAFALHGAKRDVRLLLENNIERQTVLMSELIALTDRNGADSVVEEIISDCPRRTEFELQLVNLGRSSGKQLLDTQQLFESCGAFYAERKALMVSRLSRELKVLEDNVALIHALDKESKTDYKLGEWQTIVELEQSRSDLLNEQLAIQEDIITALIAGKKVASVDITELASEASQVGESLSVLDRRIDDMRTNLIDQI